MINANTYYGESCSRFTLDRLNVTLKGRRQQKAFNKMCSDQPGIWKSDLCGRNL